jgi:hypothetical protein
MSSGDPLRPPAAASSAAGPDDVPPADLAYWQQPAGRRVAELLETCDALPDDEHIDRLTSETRQLAERGISLDAPELREVIARRDHAARVRLSRVRQGWSLPWLHGLCDRYLRHLDWLEGALSHGPDRWGILAGRGSGMDRADAFRAFWDIAREVAGIRPLPTFPPQVTRLSISIVRNQVCRLMDWCAEEHALAHPPADAVHGRTSADPPACFLPPATAAFVEYLVETANLSPNTDLQALNEWQQRSPALQTAALVELSAALSPDEGERLNVRMRRLRTLAIACPSANLRSPPADAATAYDTFATESEGFRGYVVTLAARLGLTLANPCTPPDTLIVRPAGSGPADSRSAVSPDIEGPVHASPLSTGPADPPAGAGSPPTTTDGPEGGRWVRWQGRRHEVPAGRVYTLIAYFWNRETASFDELLGAGGAVWPDPVAPQTVTSTCHRANSALPSGFPWRLSVDSASRTVAKLPAAG